MVVKSFIYEKQEQQQKRQQLQPQGHEQERQEIKTRRISREYNNHNCSAFHLRYDNQVVINSRQKVPFKGRSGRGDGMRRSCKSIYSSTWLAFIVLAVISSLSELGYGASVNSTLVDDLLMHGNHGSIEAATSTPTSVTTTVTATPSSTPGLPYSNNGTTLPASEYDNGHINFTIPIHAAPDTSIVVKHGSIVYEVISNRSISTNVGTFTVPINTASHRMDIYQQMTATVVGLRVEESAKGVTYEKGASVILANSPAVIRFFGIGFTNNTIIRFVTEEGERGTDCDDVTSTKYFHFEKSGLTNHSALVTVQLPPLGEGEDLFYVCVREDNTEMPWVHQGTEQWIVLSSYKKWLPVWAHILLLLLLLILSGLFSGLNLGLMAIDRTEIKIIINAGSEQERRFAKKIQPLRDNGNYLLCSLLLGNVLVNATLTILLDDLTSGLIAVIGSTVGIVIFGEIVPQAVCSRHGLAVGARTVWITKAFMAITFPLSYPISVILDKCLGEELGNVYNRDRLKELIRVTQGTNDLEKDEVNIIAGALELKQKTVMDVMTKLEDVYMLSIDSLLDFDTVSEIMSNGYSRIPVYENSRGNVISLLYAKDLAFVDPDDRMPLRTICEFYNNPCHFVFENVTLDVLFKVFKQGNKGHMAFVQRVKINDKSDPLYEVVGLVTLEDVIEELIQEEINDETDVWGSDHRRRSRGNYNTTSDGAILSRWKSEGTTVSPQLTLAAFQYLSTAVDEFDDTRISKTVLERMLKQNICFHIKIKNKDTMKTDPSTILYERGKPADYFIIILEGKVLAEIGKENLVFESGPFSYFGTQCFTALGEIPLTPSESRRTSQVSAPELPLSMQFTYIPDYTVRAITDLTYFQISRSMYMAAKQATLLEKSYSSTDVMSGERIDEQLQKHLDEVMSNPDCKAKENTLAITAPGDTVSEEGYKEERNVNALAQQPTNQLEQQGLRHHRHHRHNHHNLQQQQHNQQQQQQRNHLHPSQPVVIGDNNNICLSVSSNTGGLLEKHEELSRNMSRVILCPIDEKPLPDPHPNETPTFPAKLIVDGDDKCFCKL